MTKINDTRIRIGFKKMKIRIRISYQNRNGSALPDGRTRGLGKVDADGPPPVPAGLRLTEADAQVREGVQEDWQTELHVCLGARQAEPTRTPICHASLIRVQRSSLGCSVAL
jgi:hypothetical protein